MAVRPIEGADKIEMADVLGWHVVVKKGEFKPGDLCVYGEIDTIFPANNKWFSFLEGKRIRTAKFRGQISQGIAFPLCVLEGYDKPFNEGTDVTGFLGAKKWEPKTDPWYVNKKPKNNKWYMKFRLGRWFYEKFIYRPTMIDFPKWIHKTDETRVQILQDILFQHKGEVFLATEKLDGSSITFWCENGKLHVCSRNKEILDKSHIMYKAAEKYADSLEALPDKTVFQGEFIGEGVQGNKYKLKGHEIYVFNIVNCDGNYVTQHIMGDVCSALGIKTVPVIGYINITDNVDELVAQAEGKSKICKTTDREGLVLRPVENIYLHDSRFVGGRLSFKVINPKFLLKYEE